ncbi:MerR family transcriptional regulator [Clostridium intestinale]|jgi:MerR family Zn(II)-responsive transcriptional regulator of zntA|uniref:Transcriptional regulator, MerR family protein n=1 Tax=Clostridium intestinale URNW TaxID=1294142 RepID=U2NPU6_9CLOT|nr:MerR family transcriptional regulator [Clostridium intestinale]ERK30886.1 transcriptional regulator, MerR family protein [Clostridium intestinale URNW]
MKNYYKIGEVVKKLNINRETIRYYENIGLLTENKRDKNDYRLYSKDEIEKVEFILMVKSYGFSLKEIKVIFDEVYEDILGGNIEGIKKIVEEKIKELQYKIDALSETKKLLEKVNHNVLSENRECYREKNK